MALLRSIFLIILGLLLITIVTIIFVAPEAIITLFQSITGINIAVRLALALVLDLLILAVIYLRIRPTKETPDGLIVKASGARADIGIDSARSMILAAVKEVPDVYAVDVNLSAVEGKADIELDVRVEGDAINIPAKQREIDRALKQVTNKQLGLDILGRPRVHIHLKEDHIIRPSPNPAAGYVPPVMPPVPAPPPTLSNVKDMSSSNEGSAMLSTSITAKTAAESAAKPEAAFGVDSNVEDDSGTSSDSGTLSSLDGLH
jgi:hypothetical protein